MSNSLSLSLLIALIGLAAYWLGYLMGYVEGAERERTREHLNPFNIRKD